MWNSSVGRARPCQGRGRESRFPLQSMMLYVIDEKLLMAEWQSGYAAACKAVDAGSIPTSACLSPGGGICRRK